MYKMRKMKKIELDFLEYQKIFLDDTKRKNAFKKAWEVRDFEIELYWKRATYFWAFIASSFAAYFASINSDFIQNHFIQLEYIIICIGFIFSLAWTLVNIGSKNWQKNWEGHIDRLEDNFTGPLYKTVKNTFYNFSVSRINIYVSFFTSSVWMILAYSFYIRNSFTITDSFKNIDPIVSLTNLVTIICVFLLILGGKTGFSLLKQNTKYEIREIK